MTPSFFVLFWNSVKLVLCILAGQLLVGVPAAWAFAAYSVRGSRALFALYVVLMLLPFQVTMLSSYLVLDRLGMMNTHAAIILPAVFSTLPIFLTYGGFRAIPPQLFEAARIDGGNRTSIFRRVTLPLMLPFLGIGITSTSVTAINVFDEIIALSGYSDLGKNLLVESYLTTFSFLDFGKGSAITYLVMFFAGILGVFYLRNLNREVEY